jgi:polyisoprenoid-binding protein YceI
MKIKRILIAIILSAISLSSVAQKSNINVEKSSVKWLGKKVTGQHDGTINIKSGSIELQNDVIIAGDFIIDMNSIKCSDLKDEGYNQKLVGHLKSDDFFGVNTFPEARLKIKNASKFINNKSTVAGSITIKGKTEDISFEVLRNQKTFTCDIDIDRSKFNIRYGSTSFFDSLGDKAIYDIFNLNIQLVTN